MSGDAGQQFIASRKIILDSASGLVCRAECQVGQGKAHNAYGRPLTGTRAHQHAEHLLMLSFQPAEDSGLRLGQVVSVQIRPISDRYLAWKSPYALNTSPTSNFTPLGTQGRSCPGEIVAIGIKIDISSNRTAIHCTLQAFGCLAMIGPLVDCVIRPKLVTPMPKILRHKGAFGGGTSSGSNPSSSPQVPLQKHGPSPRCGCVVVKPVGGQAGREWRARTDRTPRRFFSSRIAFHSFLGLVRDLFRVPGISNYAQSWCIDGPSPRYFEHLPYLQEVITPRLNLATFPGSLRHFTLPDSSTIWETLVLRLDGTDERSFV